MTPINRRVFSCELPLVVRRAAVVLLILAASGCSAKSVSPPAAGPSPVVRLAAADAQVRAGCFDCLASALSEYNSLRADPSISRAATVGAAQTAALLAIREREMGTLESGYLSRARAIAASDPAVQQELRLLLEITESLLVRGEWLLPESAALELRRMQAAAQSREIWTAHLLARAAADALSAYLWLAFKCMYTPTAEHAIQQWLTGVSMWGQTPLITFKASTCGLHPDAAALNRLLGADARFLEIHYFLSYAYALTGRIDEAMAHRLKAYSWRPHWPTVTHALGVDYMAIEEFDAAVRFLDETLLLVPNHANARLNKAQALTYAQRFTEALQTLEPLLHRENAVAGEARYWRALNEYHLWRDDQAWADVELAATLVENALVPKLAGLIAYRRRDFEVSREKFELSWHRDPNGCDTGFFLGIVTAELAYGTLPPLATARWSRTADVLRKANDCFEKTELKLNAEIAAVRASTQPLERKVRQIKKREAEIVNNRRMAVAASYNIAVSYFNLSRKDDARRFAEEVAADEQFGARARELLARLR